MSKPEPGRFLPLDVLRLKQVAELLKLVRDELLAIDLRPYGRSHAEQRDLVHDARAEVADLRRRIDEQLP